MATVFVRTDLRPFSAMCSSGIGANALIENEGGSSSAQFRREFLVTKVSPNVALAHCVREASAHGRGFSLGDQSSYRDKNSYRDSTIAERSFRWVY